MDLKTVFLSFLIGSSLLSCHGLDWRGFFNIKANNNSLSSKDKKKEPINEEALESAKKSVWEVSLYLNFKTKQIDFSKKRSQFNINIEDSHDLIYLSHGSGFFISPQLMITNFHVIDSANEHIEIFSNRDSENSEELLIKKMKLLKVSSTYDLALLESETPVDSFLEIKKEPVHFKKDSFFLLGYPDNRFILSPVQFHSSQLKRKLILFNRQTNLGKLTGASGGPIIDQNGKVVAVNQSGSAEISIGVSHTILDSFLNGNHKDCAKISLEDCLQKEWLFLDRSYKDGNLMAKHRVSVNKSYEHWLNKKEKLNELIEKRQELNNSEEQLATALKKYKVNQNEKNKNSYESQLEEYNFQIKSYNQIVSELNELLF